ncbi:hypothetical protein PVA19_14310 [Agrobacterium sp. CNPSo 3708]|uniref:hypothetical protein n=1 Tax=unclassified Agrobacterium TaxID=2632611 RepID=UPI002363E5FF|nr:hypothetical protein [Agrobacterium sp. CNPSo 3708]MDD1499593.1 hypothetical protein [Agrobacterium sp. CNPSo 3708]
MKGQTPGIAGTLSLFKSTHRVFAKIEPDFRAGAVALKRAEWHATALQAAGRKMFLLLLRSYSILPPIGYR